MKYYYNKDGKNNGPITIEELRALAEQGVIQPQTPVIGVGKKEWTRWGVLVKSLANEEAASATPQQNAPAARPVLKVSSAPRVTTTAPVASAAQPSGMNAFVDKITRTYEAIDRMCEKICYLPGGDTQEQYKKNLGFLNAIVGVGTLLSVICLALTNGLYHNIGIFLGVLLTGAVIQYICYQMYSAMQPLLFGNKIKLSSLWLPRTLALSCVLLLLGFITFKLKNTELSAFTMNLGPILLLAGISYSCVNCTKLSVELRPEDVVPGHEFINLFRFIMRVLFTTVHILTPLFMILAAAALLFIKQKFELPAGEPFEPIYLLMILDNPDIKQALLFATLPIFTLPLFYICAFIPDFLESAFKRK